jgi:hypothetical protein
VARRRRKSSKPVGGGGARHPRSLANLRPYRGAPEGNLHAQRHGGYAQVAAEALDEKARTIYAALAADAPLRGEDGGLPSHDSVQVRLLADVLCRLDSVSSWLAGRWATDEGRPVLELESKLRREAADYLDALGMTPRSRARLGIDVARVANFDLAQVGDVDDA